MNKNVSWRTLIPLLSALLYGASPIDLIPDLIPLIGLVDDAVVVPSLLLLAAIQYHRTRKMRAQIIPNRPTR